MQGGVKTLVLLVRTLKTIEFSVRTDQSGIMTSERGYLRVFREGTAVPGSPSTSTPLGGS